MQASRHPSPLPPDPATRAGIFGPPDPATRAGIFGPPDPAMQADHLDGRPARRASDHQEHADRRTPRPARRLPPAAQQPGNFHADQNATLDTVRPGGPWLA